MPLPVSRLARGLAAVSLVFAFVGATGGAVRPASAQSIVKYGADFLAGGVGGRALGMGGAHVGLAEDVSAGYWNPAGLSGLGFPEAAYMHAERFAGVVSFDYAAVAVPVNGRSTLGLSFFRSGVNDIKNTLDAWDPERDTPRANPEDHITSFSAADMAFFVGYARRLGDRLSVGVTGKVIRRGIGDFADAWGYSFDLGVRYRRGPVVLAAVLQDATRMTQSWSVDRAALANIEDVFGEALPEGGVEVVLPVARLGSGLVLPVGESSLTVGLDVDVAFDGRRAYYLNAGDVSLHPRLGTEFSYRGVVALRAGLSNVMVGEAIGLDVTPTVGAGLHLGRLAVDYGFGDFAGLASDLGYSHRVAARFTLARQAWSRADD